MEKEIVATCLARRDITPLPVRFWTLPKYPNYVIVYRPETDEKLPALLAFAIYNKDFQGSDIAETLPPQPAWTPLWTGPMEAGDTHFFVSRGYVHVIGSPRGVGKSGPFDQLFALVS